MKKAKRRFEHPDGAPVSVSLKGHRGRANYHGTE